MDSRSGDDKRSNDKLLSILMANAICWGVALIASVALLHGTGYNKRMFLILAAGALVGCVAVWKASRLHKTPRA